MSLLRKSETKHVVTKTLRETNTPPKYLQSMSSSKGVRSTSYVHRTFVDAEPKVEPDDVRLDITNKKLQVLLKKLKKNTKGDKDALQQRIVQLLGNNFNAKNLPGAFSNLQYIYKFVSGKSTTERNPNILKEMISLEIKGPPKTKIDNFVNQTPPTSTAPTNTTEEEKTKETKKAATKKTRKEAWTNKDGDNSSEDEWVNAEERPENGTEVIINNKQGTLQYTKKNGNFNYLKDTNIKVNGWTNGKVKVRAAATKTAKTTKTTAPKQTEGKTEGGTKEAAPTEDEKQKKKFNDFWERVKVMNKKDIDEKFQSLDKSQTDVKKMLEDLQELLNKSGPYFPSFQLTGNYLAGVADKDKNKTLSADEIRKMIQSTPKLKELFSIGKTGDFDQNMDPLVSWRTSRERIDTDEDGRYSLKEFAEYYLDAVLKKKGRDQLTGTFYNPQTYTKMLKLFGIGDETATVDNDEIVPVVTPSKNPTVDNNNGGETKTSDEHPDANSTKGTRVKYNDDNYTLRNLKQDKSAWSLTDEKDLQFQNGKMFKFNELTLVSETKSKSKVPAPAAPALSQRKRISNSEYAARDKAAREKAKKAGAAAREKAKKARAAALARQKLKEEEARQQKEQARQKEEEARQKEEEARQAALLKEEQEAARENQERNKKEETKRIADESRIIVEKKEDGKYFVRPTKAYTIYKEKLKTIPETTCSPPNK